jgi:hypothetical protein
VKNENTACENQVAVKEQSLKMRCDQLKEIRNQHAEAFCKISEFGVNDLESLLDRMAHQSSTSLASVSANN